MNWKFLIPFLLLLFLIKDAKADLVTPVIYSQTVIIALDPSTTIKIIVVDWIADFVLILVALFLIKFDIKKGIKRIFLASLVGLVGGLLADILGVFGSMFDFFGIPIFMFTISFAVLYGVYYLISKYLLKIEEGKIKLIAIFMAIFTNPLWLTLINAHLFYPNYFVYSTRKQHFVTQAECRARFILWCNQCLVSNWSDDIPLLPEIKCIQDYPINVSLPQNKTCSSMQYVCNYFGINS